MSKHTTSALAIIAIAWLEAIALLKGIDGTLFIAVVAILAGIAGFKARDALGR